MALLDSREGSCIEYKLSGGKLCNKRGTQVWSAQSATWSSLWRQSFDTRHSLLDALNRSHQICPYSCQKPFFPAALNHCLLNDWLNSISTVALKEFIQNTWVHANSVNGWAKENLVKGITALIKANYKMREINFQSPLFPQFGVISSLPLPTQSLKELKLSIYRK